MGLPPHRLSALTLGALIASGEMSPVAVLEEFLSRYERLNPVLNSIVALDAGLACAWARESERRAHRGARLSALDGVPVTVKDNIFVAGFPATWGSRLYESFRPSCDDIAVMRLRAAGANLVAKTNTPEFAIAAYTDNRVFGATRNPWDLKLTPGGSSGGAVASLAAGLAPLALGTDAGGSIRRPASYVGVVGFRPSTGRIPRAYGFPALAHDFQVIAPSARSVDDAYLLFRTIAGPDSRDRASSAFVDYPLPGNLAEVRLPRLRIRCVLGVGDAPVDPRIRASVESAARVLAKLGHAVEDGLAPYEAGRIERIFSTLSTAGLARVVARHDGWEDRVHPDSSVLAERGARVKVLEYLEALDDVAAFRLELTELFETVDVLLMPVSAALPWPIESPYPARIDNREAGPRGAAIFAPFVNVAGLPAISVPVAPTAQGLPVGMQLVGGFGDDVRLMALAAEYEQAEPWVARWPALVCTE